MPKDAPLLAKTLSSVKEPPTASSHDNMRPPRWPTALPVFFRPFTTPSASFSLDVIEEQAGPQPGLHSTFPDSTGLYLLGLGRGAGRTAGCSSVRQNRHKQEQDEVAARQVARSAPYF